MKNEVINRKNILLTGGTGFLGSAFLQYTLNLNTSWKIFVISSGRTIFEKYTDPNITYIKHDLIENEFPSELKGIKIDTLVHLATSSTIGPSFDEYTIFNRIQKVDTSILDIAIKTECKNIIWASSGAVYGEADGEAPFSERNHMKLSFLPTENAYRIGKIQSEFIVSKFSEIYMTNLTILRLFSFSGANLPINAHFALGNFVADAINRQKIIINGTGEAVRSYLDQRDFAKILFEIIKSEKNLGIINVGSPTPVSIADLAKIVSAQYFKITGINTEIVKMMKSDESKNYYVPDTRKLTQKVNAGNFIPLEKSITDMLQHFLIRRT